MAAGQTTEMMLASMREAMTKGLLAQCASMDDEALRALAEMLRDMADGCDRQLAQRTLARSAPAGRA